MTKFFEYVKILYERVGLGATVLVVSLACLLCGSFMEFKHEPRITQVEDSLASMAHEMDSIKMLLKIQNTKLDLLIGMYRK